MGFKGWTQVVRYEWQAHTCPWSHLAHITTWRVLHVRLRTCYCSYFWDPSFFFLFFSFYVVLTGPKTQILLSQDSWVLGYEYAAKDDFELAIPYIYLPSAGSIGEHKPALLSSAGIQTQGFMHTSPAFYQLNCIPTSSVSFKISITTSWATVDPPSLYRRPLSAYFRLLGKPGFLSCY